MTDDRIALRELLEKGSDATFLREMIGFAAHRLMELDAEGACGAGHGERSADPVIQEAYVQGISTRSVDDLVRAMGMGGVSKSQVSRLCAEIDSRVQDFLGRPIEGDWPYLWLDATYVKVREAGRILPGALPLAGGGKPGGRPAGVG